MQSSKTTLADLLNSRFSPIQKKILSEMGPSEISALARTSKGFEDMVDTLKAADYNINAKLLAYVSDPVKFRSVQAKCNALLRGGFVRAFLDRQETSLMTLKILTEDDEGIEMMKEYLEAEGYAMSIKTSAVWSIYCFEKTSKDGSVKKIQVTECDLNSCMDGLFQASTHTAELNFISWNKVYSLFPYATFVKRETYLLGGDQIDERAARKLAQASKDGFKTKSLPWDRDDDSMTCLRRVGDKRTWMMELDTTGITASDVPDSVLEVTTFKLKAHQSESPRKLSHYRIKSVVFDHPVLKHRYVVYFNVASVCQLWVSLFEQTVIEMMKIPEAERPVRQLATLQTDYHHHVSAITNLDTFDKPATWTFFDDEVIERLAKSFAEEEAKGGSADEEV
ncbi:hypothetical protein BDV95DRAFT_605425 [Massariosphaeria phaeospora]|uniref:Uncharacterized protein n=1 Tax=Massariosphaeria phaeospora TaxID=100035 RepID=A0A7C8I7T8_9PLEO|nr:hypothetical protein BDV95DRAFT_605425 [Massariosphaeria phaeospora]